MKRAPRDEEDEAAEEEEVVWEVGNTRGELGEGILWGMPAESRGTAGAAQCACVELISSPSSLLRPALSRSRVLAAPEESMDSRGIWPRCLFALSTLFRPSFTLPSLSRSPPLA